jgi:uncharacterized surface protein with fasciclin (FAS1) repeats
VDQLLNEEEKGMLHRVIAVAIISAAMLWSPTVPAFAGHVSPEARACLRTDPVQFQGTIVDAAVATPAFSTLVGALQDAGLVSALQGPGPFTVFAPTNEAFGKVPGPVLQAIVGDSKVLTAVLTYHVVPDSVGPRRTTKVKQVESLQGQSVFLSVDDDGGRVNQSNIACQAVKTTNGTIFVIDSVLLPQF